MNSEGLFPARFLGFGLFWAWLFLAVLSPSPLFGRPLGFGDVPFEMCELLVRVIVLIGAIAFARRFSTERGKRVQLLAALVCVATMVVQIPSPMQGYVNLGDCFVLLSGWLLGPWYGFAAGGIGSMLADIFLGYAHYAPGTLVIKGVMALVAALMYEKMGRTATSRIAGGVVSEIIMVLGYFGYASLLLGKGLAAAASIPGNIFQGAVGLVVGVLLVTVLERAKVTEKLA